MQAFDTGLTKHKPPKILKSPWRHVWVDEYFNRLKALTEMKTSFRLVIVPPEAMSPILFRRYGLLLTWLVNHHQLAKTGKGIKENIWVSAEASSKYLLLAQIFEWNKHIIYTCNRSSGKYESYTFCPLRAFDYVTVKSSELVKIGEERIFGYLQ